MQLQRHYPSTSCSAYAAPTAADTAAATTADTAAANILLRAAPALDDAAPGIPAVCSFFVAKRTSKEMRELAQMVFQKKQARKLLTDWAREPIGGRFQ